MKRFIYLIIAGVLFLTPTSVSAMEQEKVHFSKCVDGDTAKFILDGEQITVRFLAVDTPETKHPTKGVEPYGPEASEYTCNSLKNANKIVLEYDSNSDKTDKYNRYLAWVWVDDILLQKELINNGLAKVAYLYDDYKYTNELKEAETIAQEKNLGVWTEETTEDNKEKIEIDPKIIYCIGTIVLAIVYFGCAKCNFPKTK